MATRPLVTIQNPGNKDATKKTLPLPFVLVSPIRRDIVQFIHTNMSKNSRQPYAVNRLAGMQTAAQSWGTGRAVSRIPRVPGGGTHRAGQGAFGNMCRGGRMFAPTKTYRKWHRKMNIKQRRYATCSALAATAVPALVMSRGHLIDHIPEVPLVVADSAVDPLKKTKEAIALLKSLGAYEDCEKARNSKKIRPGKGKARGRRYLIRKGPLIIHTKDINNSKVIQSFRNIPGISLCNVHRLNLLQLAPGGHLGRFVVWTESAFRSLKKIYGSPNAPSKAKKDFSIPRCVLTNSDIGRIVNSTEVQSVLRPKRPGRRIHTHKKNPLKNLGAMVKLNPYFVSRKRKNIINAQKAKLEKRKARLEKAEKKLRTAHPKNKKFLKILHAPAVAPVRGPEEVAPKFQ